MAQLAVQDLVKVFPSARKGEPPTRALDRINFTVSGNVFVSVVGPSGCGKSTLLNLFSGVETATSGMIEVTANGRRARLGYVFQDPRLLPWRTVIQNLLYVHDDRSDETRARVERYLRMVGLEGAGNAYPAQLSGGMQQRVGIARAFSVEPDVLLMDEPFSHLDAITARGLRGQLQSIWSETRKTVLFVTHDVLEAVQLSDRILILRAGGTLHADVPIDLPRPRRLSDPTVAAVQAEILGRFEEMGGA